MKTNTIEEAFTSEGYVSIPFSFNGAGHPMIRATFADNVQANILLDTGASINLLDDGFARELGPSLTPTGEKGSGAGGLSYDVFSVGSISLEVSGQEFSFDTFYTMDMSSMNEALTAEGVGGEPLHGILGVGFFKMTKCFIDYSDNRIFVLNKNH